MHWDRAIGTNYRDARNEWENAYLDIGLHKEPLVRCSHQWTVIMRRKRFSECRFRWRDQCMWRAKPHLSGVFGYRFERPLRYTRQVRGPKNTQVYGSARIESRATVIRKISEIRPSTYQHRGKSQNGPQVLHSSSSSSYAHHRLPFHPWFSLICELFRSFIVKDRNSPGGRGLVNLSLLVRQGH